MDTVRIWGNQMRERRDEKRRGKEGMKGQKAKRGPWTRRESVQVWVGWRPCKPLNRWPQRPPRVGCMVAKAII